MGGPVLVTGGSGFIASHTILQLLAAERPVRATVRSAERERALRDLLAAGGGSDLSALSVRVADLTSDVGWREAVEGCDAVLHMASPLPAGAPKHEDELIVPARDGALRVLRFARDAGVRRVVLTSSFAAIGYGQAERAAPFDERDWTELRPDTSAYVKSKTLAERAAWDFLSQEGGGLELAVVNPCLVLGPVLGRDYSSSVAVVARLLQGAVPACPRLTFGLVDVRDVADLHLRAMVDPAARGERFLACADRFRSMHELALVLRNAMGRAARRVPSRELPDWAVRLAALFSSTARAVVPELGKRKEGSNAKARRRLGWSPRSAEEAVVSCAESLLRLGLIDR